MAHEPEEVRTDYEEDGGPVKSFLEHLEDLRWTLIKSAAAVAVGMVLCLIAGDTIVRILKRPLERSSLNLPSKQGYSLSLQFGTNHLGTFNLATNLIGTFQLWTNHAAAKLNITQVGSNYLVALEPVLNPDRIVHPSSKIELLNLSPAGGFFVAFQVAFYAGLVLASPFILYFVGQFVLPALKINEKKYLFRGLGIGSVLFFLGVAFCYFILMPMALAASFKYSQWLGFSALQWRAEEYIGFVCKFMLGMGLGFEMPVVILMLVKLGLVTADQLAKFRAYMVVINLVLGAVLTTPEVLTQLMMFVPLQFLYEVSIWIARSWERQAKKREAEETSIQPKD